MRAHSGALTKRVPEASTLRYNIIHTYHDGTTADTKGQTLVKRKRNGVHFLFVGVARLFALLFCFLHKLPAEVVGDFCFVCFLVSF